MDNTNIDNKNYDEYYDITNIDDKKYDKYYDITKKKDDIFFGRNEVGEDIFKNIPQIFDTNTQVLNKYSKDNILKKEQENIRKEEKKIEPDTIMDDKLGDIISNMSNIIINFWSDYKKMLVKIKLEMDEITMDDKDKNITYLVKIHMMALLRYLQTNNNSIYIGIFLILISILIYFINIIR
jgi:hypothetical protein